MTIEKQIKDIHNEEVIYKKDFNSLKTSLNLVETNKKTSKIIKFSLAPLMLLLIASISIVAFNLSFLAQSDDPNGFDDYYVEENLIEYSNNYIRTPIIQTFEDNIELDVYFGLCKDTEEPIFIIRFNAMSDDVTEVSFNDTHYSYSHVSYSDNFIWESFAVPTTDDLEITFTNNIEVSTHNIDVNYYINKLGDN